jgi:hypothetical protein
MANFTQRRQFKTRTPQLKVDAGLPAGTYVFQLMVEDQSGNRSAAAKVRLKIVAPREPIRPGDPVPVITPLDPIRDPTIPRRRLGNP